MTSQVDRIERDGDAGEPRFGLPSYPLGDKDFCREMVHGFACASGDCSTHNCIDSNSCAGSIGWTAGHDGNRRAQCGFSEARPRNRADSRKPSDLQVHRRSAGNYAIAFFHAQQNETQLTPGLFGKPTQGYGFSNNAAGSFGPPNFTAAAFAYDGHPAPSPTGAVFMLAVMPARRWRGTTATSAPVG